MTCIPSMKKQLWAQQALAHMWASGPTARPCGVIDGLNRVNPIRGYDTVTRAETGENFGSVLHADGARIPRAAWSDGTTLWVTNSGPFTTDMKIFAYWLDTKYPDPNRRIEVASGNQDPRGLWSDGTTMWVADLGNDKLYAYSVPPASDPPDASNLVTVDRITGTTAWVNIHMERNPYSFPPETLLYGIEVYLTISYDGREIVMVVTPDDTTISVLMDGLQPETTYTVSATFYLFLLDEVTFTTAHPRVNNIVVTHVAPNWATVRVSLKDVGDASRTVYVQYKKSSDSGAPGNWSTPVSKVVKGSAEFELTGMEERTSYDVRAYMDANFPSTFPSSRPFVHKEGTWLEKFNALLTPFIPEPVWEATMTVGTDSGGNLLGYNSVPPTFGALTPRSFSVSGTQYTVVALAYTGPSNLLSITFNEAFTLFDFTLAVDGVTLRSNEEAMDSIGNEKKYTWEIPNPSWSDGQSVNVRLLMDICDRSQGVVDAILATTPSYDFCDGVDPAELADITVLDVTGFSVGRLRNSDFDDLPNLRTLDLSGTTLVEDGRQNLPADAFQGLSNLTTLDLSNNPILDLPEGIFDGLSNLIHLDLSDTQVGTLPQGLFDGLTSLRTLEVRNAGSQDGGVNPRFHPDLFQDQGNLTDLDVRPSTPLLAAPLSFKPLTSLTDYNNETYTRPADGPANLDYSSKANYGRWGGHTVTLTWDAPTGVTGITGYRVLRTSQDIGPQTGTRRSGGGRTWVSYANDYSRFAYEIARTGASTTFYVDGRNRDLVFSDGEVDSDGGLAPGSATTWWPLPPTATPSRPA